MGIDPSQMIKYESDRKQARFKRSLSIITEESWFRINENTLSYYANKIHPPKNRDYFWYFFQLIAPKSFAIKETASSSVELVKTNSPHFIFGISSSETNSKLFRWNSTKINKILRNSVKLNKNAHEKNSIKYLEQWGQYFLVAIVSYFVFSLQFFVSTFPIVHGTLFRGERGTHRYIVLFSNTKHSQIFWKILKNSQKNIIKVS